jgi:hypothetical protein
MTTNFCPNYKVSNSWNFFKGGEELSPRSKRGGITGDLLKVSECTKVYDSNIIEVKLNDDERKKISRWNIIGEEGMVRANLLYAVMKGKRKTSFVDLSRLMYAQYHGVERPFKYSTTSGTRHSRCIICHANKGIENQTSRALVTFDPRKRNKICIWSRKHNGTVEDILSHPDYDRYVYFHPRDVMFYGHMHGHAVPKEMHDTEAFRCLQIAVDVLIRTKGERIPARDDIFHPFGKFYDSCSERGKIALDLLSYLYVTSSVPGYNIYKDEFTLGDLCVTYEALMMDNELMKYIREAHCNGMLPILKESVQYQELPSGMPDGSSVVRYALFTIDN